MTLGALPPLPWGRSFPFAHQPDRRDGIGGTLAIGRSRRIAPRPGLPAPSTSASEPPAQCGKPKGAHGRGGKAGFSSHLACVVVRRVRHGRLGRNLALSGIRGFPYVPWGVAQVHIVVWNLKTWLRGTFHGVSPKHFLRQLQQFSYRFDRCAPRTSSSASCSDGSRTTPRGSTGS